MKGKIMSYLTLGDIFNALAVTIKGQFPDVRLYFEGKESISTPELVVYVLDKERLADIKKFCQALEQRPTEPPVQVKITVSSGCPPFAGGSGGIVFGKRQNRVRA